MAKAAKRKSRKRVAEPASRGLRPAQVASGAPPAKVSELARTIEQDGGRVLASYRDPLGGKWQLLAALPIETVGPTPYQRDLSQPHVERLARALEKLDRYLDPIVTVRAVEGGYWTPNGNHRLAALRQLGARAITALVVPEPELAYEILALNTEKAHNLRERALEVIRMARDLAQIDPRPEREYAAIFEEPALLTLGACYQRQGRFPGSVYHPVLKRVEGFLGAQLPRALETREARAERLLELERGVTAAVAALKERGLESPYLKNYVVARINPLRFQRGKKAGFEETLDRMESSLARFSADEVKLDQLARTGGPPPE